MITRRQLNRAFLERQLLLERANMSILEATEHLVCLQAQIPNPPYIGLWTRLRQFERDDLTQLMQDRRIVRAAMLRSTLHLVTAEDHQRFRMALQPALVRALRAFFGKRGRELDYDVLVDAAREFLAEEPRTTGELKKRLLELNPDGDGDAMAYAVRTYLPLIQVPPGGTWGSGSSAAYVMAEDWLGGPAEPDNLEALLHRYLVAFGPASVMDFQAWSGMTKMSSALKPYLKHLREYEDEDGKILYDLPDKILPDEDTPAPIRYIPEYDNLVISHANRTRIISDEDRPKVFLSAARVLSTFLIDGFVAGTWKIETNKQTATLNIQPFREISDQDRTILVEEGERLVRFVEDTAENIEVRFL